MVIHRQDHPPPQLLTTIARALILVASANVIFIIFASSYDWRLGPLHLTAHGIFKPSMILNGLFYLAVLTYSRSRQDRPDADTEPWMPPCLISITLTIAAAYSLSFWVNYHDSEWAHTDISAAHQGLQSLASFFTVRSYDGFYRPLVFVSLWADWRLFGEALNGYHIQSIGLHLLNAYLVSSLCLNLGATRATATAAALVFAVSASSFETVMWPGARFDEMATVFTLLALVSAIRYAAGKGDLASPACCCALAIISKENAYSIPLLLAVLFLKRRSANLLSDEVKRWVLVLLSTSAVAAVGLAVRWQVLGGVGGYVSASGSSLHFALTPKTLTSLMERAPLASLVGIDGTVHLSWWIQVTVAVYALLLSYIALRRRSASPDRIWWYLICLLMALLPTANVITFLTPALVQGRHLYFASVWSAILLGSVLVRTIRPRLTIGLWVLCSIVAIWFNISVHKRRLDSIPASVVQISGDLAASPHCAEVLLTNMPDQMNGSFFSSEELLRSLHAALPQIHFNLQGATAQGATALPACLKYAWADLASPAGPLTRQ